MYTIGLKLLNAPLDKKLTLYSPPAGVPAHVDYPGTFQLVAQVTLSNLSNSDLVTWKVEPASVATVSPTGLLSALGPAGVATVTASSIDGLAQDTVQVTVKQEGGIEAEVE